MQQFWFVANVVWTTQKINDDNIKKAQLVTVFHDRTLSWYIKYCSDNSLASLVKTKAALNKEFSKPKSDLQLVV